MFRGKYQHQKSDKWSRKVVKKNQKWFPLLWIWINNPINIFTVFYCCSVIDAWKLDSSSFEDQNGRLNIYDIYVPMRKKGDNFLPLSVFSFSCLRKILQPSWLGWEICIKNAKLLTLKAQGQGYHIALHCIGNFSFFNIWPSKIG